MFLYQPYVKKEDVRDVADNQRKMSALIIFALALIVTIMQIVVTPKLRVLYFELEIQSPLIVRHSSAVMWIISVFSYATSLYLFFTKPDYFKVDSIAKKYKAGEMIKVRELVDNRFVRIPMLFIGLTIAYIVLSIVLPIYSLTNQF